LDADACYFVTVSGSSSESYQIARFELIDSVVPTMIRDKRVGPIIHQHTRATIVCPYTDLSSGGIERRHLAPYFTRL
jgi:hypothetical protein